MTLILKKRMRIQIQAEALALKRSPLAHLWLWEGRQGIQARCREAGRCVAGSLRHSLLIAFIFLAESEERAREVITRLFSSLIGFPQNYTGQQS